MTTQPASAPEANDREILLSRIFSAPRELVWQAMTDPKHVVRWWGPRGFTTTIKKMDVRPGGIWEHTMHGPDGANYPNKSVFTEVVKPERIVYSHGGGREGGPGVSFVATRTFSVVEGGKTKLTLRMVFSSAEARDRTVREFGAIEGGKQTLERLAEQLPKMAAAAGDFVISRTFAAPRALVWRAWTERERLMEWFGPKGCTVPFAGQDFRVGGKFHYCMQSPDGGKMWGRFVYRAIVEPERIVWINSFSNEAGELAPPPFEEAWPQEMLSTVTFSEHEGRTTVTLKWSAYHATAEQQAVFDANHDSMNQGWGGSFEQLTAYLTKTQNGA